MNGRYVILSVPQHPLAGTNGAILEHRMVLYDTIGPGIHTCHWCTKPIRWHTRTYAGAFHGDLVVDHLDGNTINNTITNLVPSCQQCNILRNSMHTIQPGEQFVIRPSGHRARASECNCAICGITFLRINSSIVAGKPSYCSKSCKDAARKRVGTTCKYGHELNANTTYEYKGNVRCRLCQQSTEARYRATHRKELAEAERIRRESKKLNTI